MMALDKLAIQIREVNKKNGWNLTQLEDWSDPYKIPAVLALIHSEISEALEDFRIDSREHFLEELADVQIRLLDLAGGLTNEFESHVRRKIAKNAERAFRHGDKRL